MTAAAAACSPSSGLLLLRAEHNAVPDVGPVLPVCCRDAWVLPEAALQVPPPMDARRLATAASGALAVARQDVMEAGPFPALHRSLASVAEKLAARVLDVLELAS